MSHLLLENLNYLVSAVLCLVEFSHRSLVLLFDCCKLLERLFKHRGEFKGFHLVLVLFVLHVEYNRLV